MISFFGSNGGSGEIRGRQIAEKIGARFNPTEGYENDTCVYIKMAPPKDHNKKSYVDPLEWSNGYQYIVNNNDTGIIASSKSVLNYLTKRLMRHDIVLIPEHHCNFERVKRTRKEVKVAGIVGNRMSFQYDIKDMKKRLEEIGVELRLFIKWQFGSREEVVEAYKQMDVQLIWRPRSDGVLKNPLKITNANSFGIPTVAYPETNFVEEYNGYYMDARSIDYMIMAVKQLKENKTLYDSYAKKCLEKAEEYHIDTISKLYLRL